MARLELSLIRFLVLLGADFALLDLLLRGLAQRGQFFFALVEFYPPLVESLVLLSQQRVLLLDVLLQGLSLAANLVLLALLLSVQFKPLGGKFLLTLIQLASPLQDFRVLLFQQRLLLLTLLLQGFPLAMSLLLLPMAEFFQFAPLFGQLLLTLLQLAAKLLDFLALLGNKVLVIPAVRLLLLSVDVQQLLLAGKMLSQLFKLAAQIVLLALLILETQTSLVELPSQRFKLVE